MIVIAVTGGICDGKSTVVKMFEEYGAQTRSADAVARELLQPGTELWEQARKEFASFLNLAEGPFDRRQLADLISENSQARKTLNRLMHPPIMEYLNREIAQARSAASSLVFVVEVPLLIEIGKQGDYDRILVAYAGPALQLERLTARIGDSEKAARYLQTQLPTSVKVAFADWVVPTHQPIGMVRENVSRIWTLLSRKLRVI